MTLEEEINNFDTYFEFSDSNEVFFNNERKLKNLIKKIRISENLDLSLLTNKGKINYDRYIKKKS